MKKLVVNLFAALMLAICFAAPGRAAMIGTPSASSGTSVTTPGSFVEPPCSNSASSGSQMTDGTANHTSLLGISVPSSQSVSTLLLSVSVADNSANLYSFGVYNAAGTLVATTGALTGSTAFASAGTKSIALVGAPVIIPGGKDYFASTSNAATPALRVAGCGGEGTNGNQVEFFPDGTVASCASASGVLPGTCTMPADAPSVENRLLFTMD